MANITCPHYNEVDKNQPIPADMSYVLRAGTNASDPAMTACCSPNPVNFVDGCYLWCEYPTRFSNESLSEFGRCLRENGARPQALSGRLPSSEAATPATAKIPSLGSLGLVALVLVALTTA